MRIIATVSKIAGRKREVYIFLFFFIFWILPISYTGLVNGEVPLMPRTMGYLQRIGRLFTNGVESWQIFYIQIQPKNTDTWETLEESDYFRLKPYGYRTRLHQLLIHSQDEKGFWKGQLRGYQREQELAFWVARRYAKLHPGGPDVGKVRIVCAFHNTQDGKSIKGRWVNQPLESYSPYQKIVVSTHDIK